MSDLINYIQHKVFNTRIMRKPPLARYVDPSAKPESVETEYLDVKYIIMSRDTHHEIMRLDYSNQTGVLDVPDKTESYRVYGVRIAHDDSLRFGQVLVAGLVV